ncbi:phage tail tape measure protein [Sphingobacterium sp.]|uniref:phage tail tape measure protein n=1 Tax=Sphingobacterium sp. TaxID=341027 RepID=UPI0028ADF5C1|nr:phage tail tape measure protein [Sphingobacterium sp.]
MANLKNEDLVLNIIVNGNSAQSEIGRLSRAMVDNKSKLNAAKNEMASLERQGQQNSARYRQLQQDVTRYNQVIDAYRNRLEQLRQSMRLEDQTIQDLEKTLRRLKTLRSQAAPGSAEFTRLSEQMQVVSARLAELRGQAASTGGVLRSMGNQVKSYFNSWVSGALALTTAISGIKKATEDYAAFEDKLSDVQKTTNLNKDSVKELNAELQKIQTRTSQEDLLGLARISGKLGYTEINEIIGFVKANNQLVVALNEDLGGNVEETVNQVGKLVDIFKLKDTNSTEQAFLKVGSAINSLGMASTANEGYIVDFTKRLSGIAPLTGLTIQQVMALGATMDALGQSEEVSSTALSKLFVKMASDAKTYSKYAGMSVNDFKDLLEKDFMTAFIRVMQGVKKNSNGINELAGTLGDLGEEGGRIIGVIGKMADNTSLLKNQIDLSNRSFADGISLTQEYEIKNNNAAAQLAMARKEVANYWRELGEKLFPVLTSGINLTTMFVQVISKVVTFISNNIGAIRALTLAIVTYYTVVSITAKWEAITIALKTTLRTITLALSLAYSVMTGNLGRAAAAQRLLNITILQNPYALLAAAIVGVTAALMSLGNRLSIVQKAQEQVNKTNAEAKAQTEGERLQIDALLKTIQAENVKRGEKLTAIKQLRKIMPNVLKDYSDEAILAGKATKAIEQYSMAKLFEARIKAKQTVLDNAVADEEKYKTPQRKSGAYKVGEFIVGEANMDYFNGRSPQQFKDRATMVKLSLKDLIDTQKEYEAFKQKNEIKDDDETANAPTVTGTDKEAEKEARKAAAEAKRARLAALEQAKKDYQDQLKAAGLFQKDRRTMTADELEKLAKIEEDYQKKQSEINQKYNHSEQDTTNKAQYELDKRAAAERRYRDKLVDKTDPLVQQENEAYEERLKSAGLFNIKRESMTEEQLIALEILEKNHQININKIDSEAISKHTDNLLKSYSEEISDLKIKHNDELTQINSLQQAKEVLAKNLTIKELNQIKNLSQAKKLIRNKQDLEEQAALKRHLEDLLQQLQLTLNSGQMDGINLSDSILSEEEKKVLLTKIREIKEQLAGLTGKDQTENLKIDERSKTDLLGMTVEDWEKLFTNLDGSRESLGRVYGAVEGLIQVWSQYNSFVAAGENAQLQKDEQANKKKKSNLDQRLKSGTITQEAYNAQVEKLDKDLEHKKSVVAHNQAKRERSVALMTAIVNTASGITKAFPNPWLMALIAAVGALQIGTIIKTPVPAIEGKEEGGYLNVTRAQDGRQFRAKSDPAKRGFVSSPTVIVGESGDEFVANNSAVRNPQIRPILDILDHAQRNGTISSLKMSDIIRSTMPGRASGGYVSNSTANPSTTIIQSGSNDEIVALIAEGNRINAALHQVLKNGVSVALLGPDGFNAKQAELKRIQDNADL